MYLVYWTFSKIAWAMYPLIARPVLRPTQNNIKRRGYAFLPPTETEVRIALRGAKALDRKAVIISIVSELSVMW